MPRDDRRAPLDLEESQTFRREMTHLGRRLLVPALLAILALVGLALYADGRRVAEYLASFDLRLLPAVLGLSLVNYGLRFVRWEIYLRRLDLTLPILQSLLVFLVGFVLSITPGKVGELGKAWLVRELGGGQARRAVAVVIAERLTDLLGTFAVACAASFAFPALRYFAWLGLGLVVAAVALLAWPPFVSAFVRLLERIPRLGSRVSVLSEIQEHLRSLMTPLYLSGALLLSSVAWIAEGVGFAIVVRSYAPGASWLAGIFNYCVGSLVGGLSMLPGGLLATEGVLTALLGSQGLDAAAAASATIIVRAATLWFAVGLGLLALPFLLRDLRIAWKDSNGS